MSNEQGSSVKGGSYCSKVTYDVDDDFVGNEDYLFGNYSEDVKGGARVRKPVIGLRCNFLTAQHCQRIQAAGAHKNIMSIVDIDDSESDYGRYIVLYRYSSIIPFNNAAMKDAMHYWISPWQLQLLLSDFICGIRWLHSKSLYHGNINSSTTYFLKNGHNKGIIKLGGFKACPGESLEALKKKDYSAIAEIFRYFKPYLHRAGYPNMYEVGEMCTFLNSGHLNLTTIVDDILRCPLFLDPSDRPCYITDLVRHARKYYKLNPSTQPKVDPERFLNKRRGVNYKGVSEVKNYVISEEADADDVWDALFKANAVPNSGHLVLRFGRILRCVISHRRQNQLNPVLKKLGHTSMEIEQYFRKYQPKLIQALNLMAVRTGFIFSKFRSHHSFDCGVLARNSEGELMILSSEQDPKSDGWS